MTNNKKVGILAGGGPAPGINSVIGAATIHSILKGTDVIGIQDGFKWLMQGDISHVHQLSIEEVSRIHYEGGSFLGIARDNPTKNREHLQNVVTSLQRLGIDKLITIGGDDTAFSAYKVKELAGDLIKVVHVPKTIDNDLDLPQGISTFGFQTARHFGVQIVRNIMLDAQTTSRWYFLVSMGRAAGHLALGIGRATGATLTLIPEEFQDKKIQLNQLVDILVGSIIKRLSQGRPDGVVILAEGVVEKMSEDDLNGLADVERDEYDNIRIAEIDIGLILKNKVLERLKDFNIKTTIVAKNIGYELRCADPIPFDIEYTRDLGYSAANYIHNDGDAAIVTMQAGGFVPIPFNDILDPNTGRTKVRMVNIDSKSYEIARSFMLRFYPEDFDNPEMLARYAEVTGMTPDGFKQKFYSE